MRPWSDIFGVLLKGGGTTANLSSVATTLAMMACGQVENGKALAPLNAVSHITFGDEAFEHDEPSLKYTLTGVLLNHSAHVSWASLYQKFFGNAARDGNTGRALLGGAAVAAVAYITDYHLVPDRLKPGFEQHLSPRSLLIIYVVMACSLAAGGFTRRDS